MSAKVKINKATLTQQVADGMKLEALAKEYTLSKVKMRQALKACGLRIRSFRNEAAFEIEDGEVVSVTNVVPTQEEVSEPVKAVVAKKVKVAPEPEPERLVEEEEEDFLQDDSENIFEPSSSNTSTTDTEGTPAEDADFEF